MVRSSCCNCLLRLFALALCASAYSIGDAARGAGNWLSPGAASPTSVQTVWEQPPYPTTSAPAMVGNEVAVGGRPYSPERLAQAQPYGETWIAPPQDHEPFVDPSMTYAEPTWDGQSGVTCRDDVWRWQVLPDELIYHSYWAGVHEPRLGIVAMDEKGSQSFWDGTLGARIGLLRYGTNDQLFPQGWQLDVEAAAMVRLTLDEIRDFETADYRVGVPVTYGVDNWQFKFAVYHLSSHLGDEFIIAHPGSDLDRINYVRDSVVLGASYYPHPAWRLYSEVGYAANADGGAEPWELQFGTEVARPGPTGMHGTPFLAINGHLREEHDFGGDVNTQAGWLWRNETGQVLRFGAQYFNGKSSQYQTFDDSEQQIGVGLWYDF